MIYLDSDNKAMEKFHEAKNSLLKHFEELPPQIIGFAYDFKDLVTKLNQGDCEYEMKQDARQFFRDSKGDRMHHATVERHFTIRVKIKTYSVYHNDTETDYSLIVEEENWVLSSPKIHRLTWDSHRTSKSRA